MVEGVVMRDILLITNYWHFEEEKASSRYLTLAGMIVEAGMKLEVVTSSFYHGTKCRRNYSEDYLNSFPYKITLVEEWGYSSNTSLKRLFSQWTFGRSVLKYLKNRKQPDLIYCVVPSLEVGDLITKHANKHNVKVVIDIQDLWPEAFGMILSTPIIRELIFYPLQLKANRIYSRADEIVAVSQTYVRRALKCNSRCQKGHYIYLGIELDKFDHYSIEPNYLPKKENDIWIVYIGTLGHSYDLISVMDAIALIQKSGNHDISFQVIGDGPRRKEFEDYARRNGIHGVFTGKLDYSDMVKRLCKCDIAVNPIVKNSAATIINKHADYAAAGLPVVNTQESLEYRRLLEKYQGGLNCEQGNTQDLADKLTALIIDKKARIQMGDNSRRLAEERFNRNKTYLKIVEIIKDDKIKNANILKDEKLKKLKNYKSVKDEKLKDVKSKHMKSNNAQKNHKMKLQLLLSTMNQHNYDLLKEMNISSDVIVINQWDRNQWNEFIYKGKQIKWISSKERGVGLSRNTALMKATAKICLFSDDDVRYIDGYEKKIQKAFERLPQADVIIFDIVLVNETKEITNFRNIKKIQRLHLFNTMRYGACRIAIRRESIVRENIYFSLLFGGGARYSAGEDSLFIRDCLRKKLKLYAYPLVIGYVDDSKSSWYQGVTHKLLMDKGALLYAAFPKIYPLLFLYYAIKTKKKCPKGTTINSIIRRFMLGRIRYKEIG